MCFHKWSKWKVFHREVQVNKMTKTCEKCGKTKIKQVNTCLM
jgi:hypothetical protein